MRLISTRFIDCEQWRKDFGGAGGVDHLVQTFDYKEKPEVAKYYPQYYHKTDKVRKVIYSVCHMLIDPRMAAQSTSNNSVRSTSQPCTRSPQPIECSRIS